MGTSRLGRGSIWISVFLLELIGFCFSAVAAERGRPTAKSAEAAVGPGVLVRLKSGLSPAVVRRTFDGAREVHAYEYPRNLYWVLPPAAGEKTFVAVLQRNPNVSYVAPNYVVYAHATTANDTNFGEQWALQSTNAGMAAESLWSSLGTGGPDVVIPVIDSGVDCNHADLEKNLWHNPDEVLGDHIDNDGNGYVDDDVGINTIEPDKPPCGEYTHGTWVAGVIAAVGNNGDAGINNGTTLKSIAGILWTARILPCKFMQSDSGELKNAIECLSYVAKLRVKHPEWRIVATNDSWGDLPYDQALEDAIAAQLELGILFVTSAGNCTAGSADCSLDTAPRYPASSSQPNVITVAAIDNSGKIASTSKRGRRSVHVAAPGVGILTTSPGNGFQLVPASTSIAAPHVTGLLSLLAQGPGAQPDWRFLRNLILTSGPKDDALKQGAISGRRIGGAAVAGKACTAPALQARIFPKASLLNAPANTPIPLVAVQLNCAQPGGPVPVTIRAPDGTVSNLELKDDGNVVLDDGVYETIWTPSDHGDYKVTFFAGAGVGIEDRFTVTVP